MLVKSEGFGVGNLKKGCLLREGERVEFAEAKERLKASWAVDRDDFARVKEQLKKKNAEHHVQNGRLSQSLKASLCSLTATHVQSSSLPSTVDSTVLANEETGCLPALR